MSSLLMLTEVSVPTPWLMDLEEAALQVMGLECAIRCLHASSSSPAFPTVERSTLQDYTAIVVVLRSHAGLDAWQACYEQSAIRPELLLFVVDEGLDQASCEDVLHGVYGCGVVNQHFFGPFVESIKALSQALPAFCRVLVEGNK